MGEARSKGVFFHDEPNMAKLKGCALFWKTIVVYEGFIQRLAFELPELTPIAYELIENGIMKIVQAPEDLRSGLHDKIYYGLDETLWKYLHENPENATVQPELPADYEEILRESSAKDYQNEELMKLNDSIVHYRTIKQWLEGLLESKYFPYVSPDVRQKMMGQMMEWAEKQYEQFYLSRSKRDRYRFEYRNKMLLEQLSVSSALCIESDWVPLYRRKLGDFNVNDAKTYLNGLEVVVPFADRTSVSDISMAEILTLRKNRRWNNAMNRLAELCLEVKVESHTEGFKDELTNKIVAEYQAALEEERMTKRKLGKTFGKKVLYSGISFVPVIGPSISLVAGKIADPVLNFLHKEKKQRNLPFFLNDMKWMQ